MIKELEVDILKKLGFSLLFALLAFFLPSAYSVEAKELTKVVTDMKIWDVYNVAPLETDEDGYLLAASNDYNYRYEVNFDLSAYDGKLSDGDQFALTIPAPLTVRPERFDLLDKESGESFGAVSVISNAPGQGGKAVITLKNLSDYLNKKRGEQIQGVKGEFYFSFKIEDEIEKTQIRFPSEETKDPISLAVRSRFLEKPDYSQWISKENFSKFAGATVKDHWDSPALNKSGDYRHNWQVRINTKQDPYDTIEVHDYVGKDSSPTQIIPESLKVTAGWFGSDFGLNDQSELSKGIDYSVLFNESFTDFVITIHNASSIRKNGKPAAFIVSYSSSAPVDGSKIQNNLEMKADGQAIQNVDGGNQFILSASAHSTLISGGSITLRTGSRITLYKVDSKSQERLPGARFKITPPKGASAPESIITTDQNGVAQSDVYSEEDIEKGAFLVTEIQPPNGYEVLSSPFSVSVGKEGAVRTVENKRSSISVTLAVRKKLIGGELKGGEFEFVLKDESGAEISRAKNNADGEVIFSEMKFDSPGKWRYKISEIKGDQENISYDPKELNVLVTVTKTEQGYLYSEPSYLNGGLFENRILSDKIEIPVKKVWDDKNDQDGLRPSSVTVKLLENGMDTGKRLSLSDENSWSGKFSNLDQERNGERIRYSVEEENNPKGYFSKISGNEQSGYLIENRRGPETTDVKVTKVWNDRDDQDGIRPESVTFSLVADGEPTGKTLTLTKKDQTHSNVWESSFTDLPRFDQGREIVYTVEEPHIPDGYSAFASGRTVTNTHVPTMVTLTGKKSWLDRENAALKRPSVISVALLADGKDTGLYINITEKEDWTYTFRNLNKMKDGKEIHYSVREVIVPPGYQVETDGMDMTNRYTGEQTIKTEIPSIPATKSSASVMNNSATPDTGIHESVISGIVGIAVFSTSILTIAVLRRKYD